MTLLTSLFTTTLAWAPWGTVYAAGPTPPVSMGAKPAGQTAPSLGQGEPVRPVPLQAALDRASHPKSALSGHKPTPASVMDDIKADMQSNEASLLNAPAGPGWSKGAAIVMGGAPRGDANPWWWKPADPALKSSTPWNAITPWFVIYPGTTNAATNVRVKISGITLYVLEKSTNKWKKIGTGMGNPTWASNYVFEFLTPMSNPTPRIEPDGTLSYKLNANSNPIHGGTLKVAITGSDIAAVFARITSELILDNPAGVDDRAAAQILVSVGVDYYPTMTSIIADFAPTGYAPGAGLSRFGLVKTVPRVHYFATINPPGNRDNPRSVYEQNGGVVAIPVAQFEANPPPLP